MRWSHDDGTSRTSRLGADWLIVHASGTALAFGTWLASDIGFEEPDEIDVVKFLAGLCLVLAGLPWSGFAIDPVTTSDGHQIAEPYLSMLIVAPALTNLVLHLALWNWRRRRAARA